MLFERREGERSVDPEAKKIQREDKENMSYIRSVRKKQLRLRFDPAHI